MLVIMKNNVREIMGKYEKAVEKIDRKYNVSKVKNNEKEILEKIEYEKKFIEKLKSEGKEINKDLIAKAEGRLEELLLKQVENDDKRNKREDALLEKAKLKKSIVTLNSGREVTQEEKDKMDKESLRDTTIRALNQESRAISEELIQKSKELENKRQEWNNFKYEYEKDKNGNLTGKTINDDIIKQIHKDYDSIKKEMTELSKMQEECNKYIEKLKQEIFLETQKIAKAWNDVSNPEQKLEQSPEQKPDQNSEQKPNKKQINPNAKNVKIEYNAKEDAYMVEDIETQNIIWIDRKNLKETNIELLAEKTGKNVEDLEYVDTNILRVLMNYNRDIARKYFKEVTTMGKSKENRLNDMKSIGLEINYDLRGLYDKIPGDELDSKSVDTFSLEERIILLDNANKAKDMGSATVKKGIKVKLFEKIDQFRMKFTRKNLLNMGKVKCYEEDKLENLNKDENKEERGLKKLITKEVVNEPYGLQQDVLDKLEELKVDEETKKKLDEVVEQHKEEQTKVEESKSEEPHRLTPDEYEVIEPGGER